MTYHLSEKSIITAIEHLCLYGDTDVFPHMPELAFIKEQKENICKELANLDLDNYEPSNSIEALCPKSRFGFRIVHQLPIIDTILLLASVIEIGQMIENHRPKLESNRAFSYRFKFDGKGGIFRADCRYRDWLDSQQKLVKSNLKIKKIITTDISDFYARVNFHRLENLLDEVAPNHRANHFIKKHIKAIRAKQSFGLPVGGNAARILAELALSDTDKALEDEGLLVTRFVDDFRIFLTVDEEPYEALAFLAEQLGINEGLSLNVSKTKVENRTEFLKKLDFLTKDISKEAEDDALEILTSDLYFDDTENKEELEELKSMNLLGFLQSEIDEDILDMGRIKVIFRALKIAKPKEAIPYLINNFSELLVFAKEVVLLMQQLEIDNPECFNKLTQDIINAIISPPASSIQLIRTWLLELFVRGAIPITTSQIKRLEKLSGSLDLRQLYLIRGRAKDINFFRKNKTAFGQFSAVEQLCLIWGASCLPKDEYESWLQNIKKNFKSPINNLYLKWVKKEKENLISKLNTPIIHHNE